MAKRYDTGGRRHRRGGSIALSVVAVLTTLAVTSTSAAAAPCDPPAEIDYVIMGDSYSSGYGLTDASGDCNRSPNNFGRRLRNSLGIARYTDVSCSGARTTHWTSAQGSNPAQTSVLNSATDLVTFSIGGNDLGFTDILTNCATSANCTGDYGGATMPTLLTRIANEVGPKIETAMRQVAQKAPNAQVLVVGYPDILPAGPTNWTWSAACLPTSGVISNAERNALRGVQKRLNDEIAARAATVGGRVRYADVYPPSIGHDLCASDNWIGLTQLYHPTPKGHQEIAARLVPAARAALDQACTPPVTWPNDPYIAAGYADFIDRAPTTGERTAARTQLGGNRAATKAQRSQFVTGLANSDEYLGTVVNRMYRDTLGREGDPGGVAYWTERLRSGRSTVAEVAGQFYASGEYFRGFGGGDLNRWIGDLYQKLLHRTPDPAGLAHWRGRATRSGRNAVSLPLFQSNESARSRVSALYVALLGRPADAAGLEHWAPRVVAKGDVVLAVDLATSAEYVRRAALRFP